MPDYKAMYFELAAQVANAVELLIKAQQDGEESAMQEEPILKILPSSIKNEDQHHNNIL